MSVPPNRPAAARRAQGAPAPSASAASSPPSSSPPASASPGTFSPRSDAAPASTSSPASPPPAAADAPGSRFDRDTAVTLIEGLERELHSNAFQDKASNLQTLTGLWSNGPEIHYDVAERLLLDDGRVLQRHVLRAGDGEQEVEIPACIFVTVRDGRIVAIHEYLDTAQANRLRALSGRPPVGS